MRNARNSPVFEGYGLGFRPNWFGAILYILAGIYRHFRSSVCFHLSLLSTYEERQAAIEDVRASARFVLPEIDQLLAREGGKRLSEDVNAIGSVTVEAIAQGVAALARSPRVKAILEDQPVSLLKKTSLNPTA